MTAVAITSESATRPPTAVSGVMPVRWRSWSTNAMNAIGIAMERISSMVRRIWRLLCPGSLLLFGGGDRRLRAVGLAVVEDQRSPPEVSRAAVAAPGHRDHEAEREHPGDHPDDRQRPGTRARSSPTDGPPPGSCRRGRRGTRRRSAARRRRGPTYAMGGARSASRASVCLAPRAGPSGRRRPSGPRRGAPASRRRSRASRGSRS